MRAEQHKADGHLNLETLVPAPNLESLVKGYVLNCKIEGKSPNTISIYETILKNFLWYCRENDYPTQIFTLSMLTDIGI